MTTPNIPNFGAYQPLVTGSGGGGTPTVGNFNVGPYFGGLDGDEFGCGVSIDLEKVDLLGTLRCGCAFDLFAIDLVHSKTCGVQVDLENIALLGSVNPRVSVDLESVNIVYDKTVGCQVDLEKVDLRHDKTVGVHMSGSVIGAPFWQSVSTNAATASGSSISCNAPAGVQEGDLMVAFVGTQNVAGGAQPDSPPSGWTALAGNTGFSGTAAVMYAYAYWKIATASDTPSSSYTFTCSSGSYTQATIEIHRIIGTDTTTPIAASARATLAAASLVTDPVSPAVTPGVSNCLVFAWLLHYHAALSNTHTAPASHVERTDFQSTVTATILSSTSDTRVFAGSGSTGTATHDCTETVSTDAMMCRLAIAPGSLVIAA